MLLISLLYFSNSRLKLKWIFKFFICIENFYKSWVFLLNFRISSKGFLPEFLYSFGRRLKWRWVAVGRVYSCP